MRKSTHSVYLHNPESWTALVVDEADLIVLNVLLGQLPSAGKGDVLSRLHHKDQV